MFRIISNGTVFKAQRKMWFWWSTLGHYVGCYDGDCFVQDEFNTLAEAEARISKYKANVIQKKRDNTWTVVKMIE